MKATAQYSSQLCRNVKYFVGFIFVTRSHFTWNMAHQLYMKCLYTTLPLMYNCVFNMFICSHQSIYISEIRCELSTYEQILKKLSAYKDSNSIIYLLPRVVSFENVVK